AAHGDAGRLERHEEVGEAAVALRLGVGAEEPEEVGAERTTGRPRLLPGEAPATGRLVADRPRGDAGQVAARLGLRPALAPGLLPIRHLRQEAVLLGGRAELEERRREQEDPVLGDPLRRAGPVVLLLEDQPFPQAGVATAVRLGP